MTKRKFAGGSEPFRPRGPLALEPKAFGMIFGLVDEPQVEVRGGTAIVNVRGPLMHHEHWCCDSYDAIKARVLEALEQKPKAIVLSLDSPGGLVSGCFDTAREIRAACEAAGVPLHAYVDGATLSAAYALACAASTITAPATASVGSIGVVVELVDVTAMDAAMGVAFKYAASGARKLDGNPHAGIDDKSLAAAQRTVDYLAGLFFDHVAQARGVVNADGVRSLEAATLVGRTAMAAGLVDEIGTLDELLAKIAGEASAQSEAAPDGAAEDRTMTTPKTQPNATAPRASKAEDDKEYEAAVSTLRKRAQAGDERAKRMLAAELAEGDDDKKKVDEPDGDEATGAGDDEKKDPPPADDKAKGAAATKGDIDALRAELAAEKAKAAAEVERATLLSSRPDFTAEQASTLAKAPIEIVRDAVKSWPRGPARKPAALANVASTRGEGQGDGPSLPSDEKRALDIQMGLAVEEREPKLEGTLQVFPVMTRAQTAAWLDRKAKAAAKDSAPR